MANDVSAPFPDVDLEEQSIIEVALNGAGSQITRVVVHFTQDVPALEQKISVIPPILAHVPLGSG